MSAATPRTYRETSLHADEMVEEGVPFGIDVPKGPAGSIFRRVLEAVLLKARGRFRGNDPTPPRQDRGPS